MKETKTILVSMTMLLLTFLSSCYSYKPLAGTSTSQQDVGGAENASLAIGAWYKIGLANGQSIKLKVAKLGEGTVEGYAVNEEGSQEYRTLATKKITEVRQRVFSTGKTIAVIVVPLGILVYLVSTSTGSYLHFGSM